MSNGKKRGDGHFSLADYKKKVQGDPFVFDISTDESITINRPSGDQVLDAEAAMRDGDSREVIRALCGDVAADVLAVVGPLDAAVLKSFSTDLQEHFGLGG